MNRRSLVPIAAGLTIWCLALVGSGTPASAQAQSDKDSAVLGGLNSRQAREVARILAHYRRAKGDVKRKAAAVEEAMAWGPGAVSALSQVIAKEMQPQLERYRAKFYDQAARLSKDRVGKVDAAEIAHLRSTVLGLSRSPDFNKEAIESKADPAMKRLAEIFLVARMEVLASSRDVQAERQKLLAGGTLWEMCGQYLHKLLPESEEKPKEPPSFEKYLQGEEELAVGLSAPMDPATQAVLAANAELAKQLDPEEARAILALNLMRNLLGLAPLTIDLKLCAAARDHSKDMETMKFFAHESPVPGKKTPWDRAGRFGTTASAENIFMGSQDGAQANLAWFHSPGHHVNMLGPHKRVGMGRSGVYFTELFGR